MMNPREFIYNSIFRVRRDRELSRSFRAALLTEDGRPTPHGAAVLAYLRSFCHADLSTMAYAPDGKVDPIASAMLEGRRDVWRAIAFYLNVDERDMIEVDRDYVTQMRQLSQRGVFDS